MQVETAQFAPVSSPAFAILAYGEAEGCPANIAAFGQFEDVAPGARVRDVQFEMKPARILGQPQGAGSGAGQNRAAVVIGKGENIPARCQRLRESAGQDDFGEIPDAGVLSEDGGITFQLPASGPKFY